MMGATVCCSSVAEQPWRVHAFVAPRVPTGELMGQVGSWYLFSAATYGRSFVSQTGLIGLATADLSA